MTENMHQSLCLIEQMDDKALAPDGFWALCGEVANACLEIEGVKNAYVSISLVTGEEIKTINRETRSVDKETDVLSFPVLYATEGTLPKLCDADMENGKLYLGDIVLSTEKALAQAKEYGHSPARELSYLTVHSALHLMGFDHMEEEEQKRMRAMEEKVLRSMGLERKE